MYPSVQVNEHLKRFLPACVRSMTAAKLAKALASPYLTYQAPENEEGFSEQDADAMGLMADDGVMRTPFPMFRYCVQSANGAQMLGFVERIEGSLALVSFFRRKEVPLSPCFYAVTFTKANPFSGGLEYDGRIWDAKTLKDISEEIKYCASEPKQSDASKDASALIAMGGKTNRETLLAVKDKLVREIGVREQRISQMQGMIDEAETVLKRILSGHESMLTGTVNDAKDMFMAYYCSASIICYEYIAPQNFHAIVRPNTPGKSVEWQKAREHYTLIHRGHPANNAALAERATVDADSGKLLTRCAHSRRAHTRLLKSSRYRYKIGHRIAVKASWCGPKEWQDSAGQTYQILVPVSTGPSGL